MSKNTSRPSSKRAPVPGFTYSKQVADIKEYVLKKNGLRVLYQHRPDTGVVTTNITYLVGARDEQRGETGVAHMLEHMLFVPTEADIKRNATDSAARLFDSEIGAILNANTWRDRTTYYFSYPTEYYQRALQIEAERMNGVVLTDESLAPEKQNVLSEHDMYDGMPEFALEVQMRHAAFTSHPYGHETIGWREDIEDYTAEKLERFYRNYYRPDNAVLMVIGDISEKEALQEIKAQFSDIGNPSTPIPRFKIREPKQEGVRTTTVQRPSNTELLGISFKHAGYPSQEWFATHILVDVLTSGPESILHKLLVDTGKASSVGGMLEPTRDANLGTLIITLSPHAKHEEIEELVLKTVGALTSSLVTPLIKKAKATMITDELFARDHSLKVAAELTEYVASGNWEAYDKTISILENITTKQVLQLASELFADHNLTIGYFKGTSNQ